MPVFHGRYNPSKSPRLNLRANLLNIANFNDIRRELANFTDAQKVATFNLLVALGLAARNRSPTHLRDDVDLAHLRNKDNRFLHEDYTAVLLEGICTLMEHAEEALVFVHVYRDTKSDYFKECQSKEAIESAMQYRLPGRLANLQMSRSPFVDAAISYNTVISGLLAAFLNEKRRRIRWGYDVDRYAAQTPFVVSVDFPSAVLRRPGAPAPVAPIANTGDDLDDDGFTEEEWRLFEDAYDAAVASGETTGPKLKGKEKARQDAFLADAEEEENRLANEELLARRAAADEEAEAEAIREAIENSRQTFLARHNVSRTSSQEAGPSGSQGFPVQHVNPLTGVTTHGTFVPDLTLSPPVQTARDAELGTWVFLPAPSQTPAILRATRSPPPPTVYTTPTRAQSSSSKGKGKSRETR